MPSSTDFSKISFEHGFLKIQYEVVEVSPVFLKATSSGCSSSDVQIPSFSLLLCFKSSCYPFLLQVLCSIFQLTQTV